MGLPCVLAVLVFASNYLLVGGKECCFSTGSGFTLTEGTKWKVKQILKHTALHDLHKEREAKLAPRRI